MDMNVNSVCGAMYAGVIDPEYQRIVRELRAFGIEPSGDKSIDKAKLEAAKSMRKVESKNVAVKPVDITNSGEKIQAFSPADDAKSIDAQNMTGALQIAQMNKFKLLGIY